MKAIDWTVTPEELKKFFARDEECQLDITPVEVTPEGALALLSIMIPNRTLKKGKQLNLMVEDMKSGNFGNTTCLQFSKEGMLMDGQHRLNAQIKAKTNAKYYFSLGEDSRNVFYKDQNIKRTQCQTAEMVVKEMGYQLDKQGCDAVSNFAQFMLDKGDGKKTMTWTGANRVGVEVADYLLSHEEEAETFIRMYEHIVAVDAAQNKDWGLKSKFKRVLVTCAGEYAVAYEEEAKEFFTKLLSGKATGRAANTLENRFFNNLKLFITTAIAMHTSGQVRECDKRVGYALQHAFMAYTEMRGGDTSSPVLQATTYEGFQDAVKYGQYDDSWLVK